MEKFIFYWLEGTKEILEGDSIPDAFRKAGYGQGAISALDFTVNGVGSNYKYDKDLKRWIK